uniref:Pyrokinin-6 n=1 Tax=Eurycotis floridana TaxID=303877 RepID=PPK6_EURFL|nr:RecName: Full=Pyrokinin-6; Short=Eurfl-PK-6; AltName: Full=FXPRL-amide [Eurycotis floridana]
GDSEVPGMWFGPRL